MTFPVAYSSTYPATQAGGKPIGPEYGVSGGIAPIIPTDNILVASRCQIPLGVTGTFTATQTYMKQYQAHPAGAISKLKTIDTNWYMSSVSSFTSITSYQIARSIEYPAGVFTQVTWSSATTKTITTSPTTISDEITISIPAGAKFWVHTAWLAGTPPIMRLAAAPTTLGLDDRSGAGDLTMVGGESTSATFAYGPAAIMGTVNATNAQAALIVGDSIAYGHGTTAGPGDVTGVGSGGGAGYIARYLDPVMPYCKIAYPGSMASDLLTLFGTGSGNNRVTQFMAALGYTRYWLQHGVNDLGSGGLTAAQLMTNNQALVAYAKAGALIDVSTLTQQSSSTDSWVTQVNQTPSSNNSTKAAYNDLVRAKPAWITGRCYDASDASGTSRDSGVWKTNSGAHTTDGTHPNSLGAQDIATNLTYI